MQFKFIYGTAVLVLAFISSAVAVSDTKIINLDDDNWRTILENEWMIKL